MSTETYAFNEHTTPETASSRRQLAKKIARRRLLWHAQNGPIMARH
jgi:hypothetical protein